jgi:hypothetical protein
MPVIEVAYNPNDFYYATSGMLPSQQICSSFLMNRKEWDDKCCVNTNDKTNTNACPQWNDASANCYIYELCKNKQNADLANNLENNNAGALERHNNFQKQYQNDVLKAINISASIVLITYLSVYFFKT